METALVVFSWLVLGMVAGQLYRLFTGSENRFEFVLVISLGPISLAAAVLAMCVTAFVTWLAKYP